jgi:nucleoside phosphorylase
MGRVYRDLGEVGGTRVFLALTEMGSGGLGASQQAVHKGIDALRPGAVLLVGIAFGADDKKQRIGDILVSQQLQLYELQRVSPDRLISRGDKPHASPRLIDYFRHAALEWDESMAPVDFGLLLSGEKLVDDLDYRKQLQQFGPEAIGGEMEGAGLYVACQDAKVDWIVIKAICDWADGHKQRNKTARQQLAAGNAAAFVAHALQQAPLKRPESPMEQPPASIQQHGFRRGRRGGSGRRGGRRQSHRCGQHRLADRQPLLRRERPAPLRSEQIAQQVAGYLRWLQARTENIELRGIERAGGAPVVLLPLETAYVPLRAKWMRGDTDIALNKVLGLGNRLVIVGGPGSGKTTVLLHMAWALASSLLNRQSEPARSRLGPLMKPSERDEQGKPKKPQEYQAARTAAAPLRTAGVLRALPPPLGGQRTSARADLGALHLVSSDRQASRFRSARRFFRATVQGRTRRTPAAGRVGRSGE